MTVYYRMKYDCITTGEVITEVLTLEELRVALSHINDVDSPYCLRSVMKV